MELRPYQQTIVDQIRDAHSRAYNGGKPGTPWRTDEDAMIEKTAAKKFLRKYVAEGFAGV